MCFAGPSMGNSADADQMSPDVSSLLNEVYLYPKLITGLKFYMCGDRTSLQFYVYFESKSDRVLIYVILLSSYCFKVQGHLVSRLYWFKNPCN